jgi:hypothetical protein
LQRFRFRRFLPSRFQPQSVAISLVGRLSRSVAIAVPEPRCEPIAERVAESITEPKLEPPRLRDAAA